MKTPGPIAFGSHLFKIVEKTIKLKIEKLGSELPQTADYHFGFQAGINGKLISQLTSKGF